jgi:glycosyltransferase involved in cell wall biosynthesis
LFSILLGLAESGLLARVATTISLTPRQVRLLSGVPFVGTRLVPAIKRRQLPAVLDGKVDNIWVRELLRSTSSKIAHPLIAHAFWKWAELGFDRIVASRYGGHFELIYGMEHSSAATFTAQKAHGGRCVLRQVCAHAQTINAVLRRESGRFAELLPSHHPTLMAHIDEGARRKEVEYGLADLIVANSKFVRNTFIANGVSPNRVVAAPTGCPPVDPVGARAGAGSETLRFLYVGGLSLIKGILYLLEAWRAVRPKTHAELWIAGRADLDVAKKLQGDPTIRYFGTLAKDALRKVYRQADVFVLPTLCEGLSHAVLEAMSFGLPVITTEASGAGDLIVDGENGFLVPEADAEALASVITRAIALRTELPGMGRRSAERAKGWTVAEANLRHLHLLQEFLS